jgi:acylphosphatase
MKPARAHAWIEGRVQGVWFRASTRETARELGLSEWVRNLPTGEVEAVFEGPKDLVEKALSWCRQGPPGARVSRCDVTWEDPREEDSTFEIRS